jgi:import inner membrane translocase subunit TIM16
VLVAGATVVLRAATQAWGQALINAQKTGVAQEAVKTATGKLGQMTVQEAQMILGVEKGAPWGEVVKRYKHLFSVNDQHGSFYLQSKVFRAKEALEDEYKAEGAWEPLELETGNTSSTAAADQKDSITNSNQSAAAGDAGSKEKKRS